jgi:protein TonB
MKLPFASFLLSILVFSATAQELKKVKHTLTFNSFPEEQEEYYVLKSDKKIKHGPYQRWVNGKIIETGSYKNNQKHSVWTKIFPNTESIREQGNYTDNERTGIWQFYSFKNELEYSYDFTNRKVVSINEATTSKTAWVVINTDTLQTIVEHPALFIGGTASYGEILAKNMRSPAAASRRGVAGKIFISFIVDEEGRTSNYKITKSLEKDCDEEALRVYRMLTEWIPAVKDGKPVKSVQMVSFNFNSSQVIIR